jgi:hypothetical protein
MHKRPEEDDPFQLDGVGVPDPEGRSVRLMARSFAEEFLGLGFPPGRVLALFESPRYALPHQAFRALGAAEVQAIVEGAARRSAPRTASHHPAD